MEVGAIVFIVIQSNELKECCKKKNQKQINIFLNFK